MCGDSSTRVTCRATRKRGSLVLDDHPDLAGRRKVSALIHDDELQPVEPVGHRRGVKLLQDTADNGVKVGPVQHAPARGLGALGKLHFEELEASMIRRSLDDDPPRQHRTHGR